MTYVVGGEESRQWKKRKKVSRKRKVEGRILEEYPEDRREK